MEETTLLSTAKKTLKKYPTLDSIFNSFNMLPKFSYGSPNVILSKCAKADSKSIAYLDGVEKEISNLIKNNKIKTDVNGRLDKKFVNRITSKNPSEYLPVLAEIHLANYLLNLFGKDHFFYEEGIKSEKKADFVVTALNREIHLELRRLMTPTPQKKIESIFEQVCDAILDLIKNKNGIHFLFRLDTAKLPKDNEQHIDIAQSVKLLLSCYSQLNLVALVNVTIYIDFYRISKIHFPEGSKDVKASEVIKKEDFANLFGCEKGDNNETQLSKWLETVCFRDLQQCPFEFFEVTSIRDNTCVSISPIDIQLGDPNLVVPGSSASQMNRNSFIDQIRRAIDSKCKSGQRKAGEPSILILDTWDWHFDYFEFESFLEIKKYIQEELRKCPDISGLILYSGIEHYTLHDGRYVENDACNQNIRLGEKELEDLFLIKPHNDPKITSEKITSEHTYQEQLKTIQEMISVQPGITLKQDKIELLSNIETFLLNSAIENYIVTKLKEIITEYCFDTDPTGTECEIYSDSEETTLSMEYPTVRSLAASCLCKLLKHTGSPNDIELVMDMAKDNSTLVRESVVENLPFLYQIDPAKAMSIAKNVLNDNERVRLRMTCVFLHRYLCGVNKQECLELCSKIVTIQNESSIVRDDALNCAVNIICVGALEYGLSSYVNQLERLATNSVLKQKVRNSVAYCCNKDKFFTNKALTSKLIQIYDNLVRNSANDKPQISSIFLNSLIANDLPLFPEISSLLEILSNERYPEFSYHVTIIQYLEKFGSNFPEQTTKYLKNITNNNPQLFFSPVYPAKIFRIIKEVYEVAPTNNCKNDLIFILQKMTQSAYVNLNLPEAKELLKELEKRTNGNPSFS